MVTATDTKSSPLRQGRVNGISSSPMREAPAILPPLSAWQQHKSEKEVQKSLKRSRESNENSSRRESRILPPPPKYSNASRQTKSLPPASVLQIENGALLPPRSSQPDLSRAIDVEERWSPKRLRSREPNTKQYAESDDSMDDSDTDSDDNPILEPIEDKEYDVEAIDGERRAHGIHEYWIRWVGYADRTWTAAEDCSCPDSVMEMRRVQGADLEAARRGGRSEEVETLGRLRGEDGEREGSSKGKNGIRNRNAKLQDGKLRNGRSGRLKSVGEKKVVEREVADSLEGSVCESEYDEQDDEDNDEVKSEPNLGRHIRANTAWRRLGSVEREEASDLRYITWFRSKPIDIDVAMIHQIENRVSVEPLPEIERTDTPCLEMCGWSVAEDAQEEDGMNDGNLDIAMRRGHGLASHSLGSGYNPNSLSSFVLRPNHLATVSIGTLSSTITNTSAGLNIRHILEAHNTSDDISDTDVRGSIEQQTEGENHQSVREQSRHKNEGSSSQNHTAEQHSRERSVTFIKDEEQEADNLRSRKQQREKKRMFDNAVFISNSVPKPTSPPHHHFLLFHVEGANDNASKLKVAREKESLEAVKRQNGNALRRELDSSSARRVQELVKQSRATVNGDLESRMSSGMEIQTRSGFIRKVMNSIET